MKQNFKSVSEMINKLSTDDNYKKIAKSEIEQKRLSKLLFLLRCQQKLSQGDLAKKIGCSQSKVSKIESSYDEDLSLSELIAYANALNLELEVSYKPKHVKLVDEVKYYALKIKQCLSRLAQIAKTDDSIKDGVIDFHLEAVLNINKLIVDSLATMDTSKNKSKSNENSLRVTAPFELQEKIEQETECINH